ncbi:MAG: cytochrome P450, partial [Deltaproteobacteria bacterium]|nr:cytochrome P450 [Deltaproteobacteria bacterium]
LRLVNLGPEPARGTVAFARPLARARAVDLREDDARVAASGLDILRTAAPPEVEGGALVARLAGHEIATYRVSFAGA